jgi:FtsH-binding integral membrane protein
MPPTDSLRRCPAVCLSYRRPVRRGRAAIMVYLDVINIFLYLLRLLQEMQSNN